MLSPFTPWFPKTWNSQPPAKAPTTPKRMSSRMPSPLLFTILLPMNPAIKPRTIQEKYDIVSPFSTLNREKSVEEGPIPVQGHAEVFRRNVVGLAPFRLQLLALGGKDFGQPFDRISHQFVGVYHRCPGFVHETDLNLLPTGAEIQRVVLREQRQVRFLRRLGRRR